MAKVGRGPEQSREWTLDRTNQSGRKLRELRLQRGLTLAQVARVVGMSASVLSRKERGKQVLKRRDIRALGAALELSPWEAYELWTAAGFVPEWGRPASASLQRDGDLAGLVQHCPFPACALTLPGHLAAWNQGFEAIWRASQVAIRPLHLLDVLLQAPVPAERSVEWESFTALAVHLFHQWAPRSMPEPLLRQLAYDLSRRYGAAFAERWQRLQREPKPATRTTLAAMRVLLPWESPHGVIRAATLRLMGGGALGAGYVLLVHLPAGAESRGRYGQWRATLAQDGAAQQALYVPEPDVP